MTLQELEQVKKDLADGVIVSKKTWEKVLDIAIQARPILRGREIRKSISDEADKILKSLENNQLLQHLNGQGYSESMRQIEANQEILDRMKP
jgi:hypothetical protein